MLLLDNDDEHISILNSYCTGTELGREGEQYVWGVLMEGRTKRELSTLAARTVVRAWV